jgi:hypothetical protein
MQLGDIEWFRGDAYPINLLIKDKNSGQEIDLTGYFFVMTCDSRKDPPDSSTTMFSVLGTIPDQTTDTGRVIFTPTSLDTDIEPATYYYDIQMTDPDGNVRTIAKYKFKILQDITK